MLPALTLRPVGNSAELSSLATALQELTDRVTAMADGANKAKDEGAAADLFEVERALRVASRRLTKLARGA